MSLKVWLPLTGTLENRGVSNSNTTINNLTFSTDGKIGQCGSIINQGSTGYTPDINNNSLSFCGWFKFNQNNINTVLQTLTYTSTASTPICNLIGNNSYGGLGLIWTSNNMYTSNKVFSSMSSYVYLRTSSTNQTTSSITLPFDTWIHLAAIYNRNNNTLSLYKNGELINSKSVNTFSDMVSRVFYINYKAVPGGNGPSVNLPFKVNDIRIYDHALSAAEVKEIAQGLVLHYKLDDITNGIVQDSSGYNNNGTITGMPVISTDTLRYSHSLYLETTNTNNHIDGGQLPSTIQTISFWHKNNGNATSYVVFAEPSSGLMFGPAGNYAVVQVSTSSKTCYAITAPYYTNGDWNHIVVQKDGDNYKLWTNGVLRGSRGSNYYRHTGSNLWLFKRNYNNNYTTDSNISDFRAYTTLLSESDIKQLYGVGAKVDNKQNLHTYEFNENGSNKLTKTGILKDYAIEPYKTLSDGSYWKLMLFHYVDNGNNLFTSSNATYNNDFGLYSRLRDIANYIYDSKYEYYVIQDGKEFRWTQTSSPTAASITGLTTVSGYTNPVNGLAKANQSNTYIGYGAWWGACGCWTKYSTGGKTGIPGFGSHDGNGICTNYLALYTRIEKPKAEIANENIYAENLIEF